MHVSTKDNDKDGAHILTNVIEGDGALPLCSEQAQLKATVISISRTESGGVQVQTSVTINEPAAAAAPSAPSPEDEAVAYFVDKGFTPDAAVDQVKRFGVDRILKQRNAENAKKEEKLDDELAQLVAADGPKQ